MFSVLNFVVEMGCIVEIWMETLREASEAKTESQCFDLFSFFHNCSYAQFKTF